VTGYTSTYHGIYLFAQFTWLAQQRAGTLPGQPWHHPVRLFQTGMEKHHLIPVDAVSNASVQIIKQRGCSGASYHLTPIQPCTMFDLEAALAHYFGYDGVRFVSPDGLKTADLNEIERAFYDSLAGGEHRYFVGDPSFDCTNTVKAVPSWANVRVSQEMLTRAFDFAVRRRFRKPRPRRIPARGGDDYPQRLTT
jgi:hypothetical protein